MTGKNSVIIPTLTIEVLNLDGARSYQMLISSLETCPGSGPGKPVNPPS